MSFLDKLNELALGKDGVRQAKAGKLNLLRMVEAQRVQNPVVQFPVVVEFQRAQRMRDSLDGVGQAVREIVHGIDAPRVAGTVMMRMADAVQRGIAHDDVGGGHVDLGAQDMRAVGKFPGLHAAEKIKVFFHAAVAPGAFLAGARERAAVFADFVRAEIVHIGAAHFDELLGIFVEPIKIVGSVKFAIAPVAAEPAHVLADGVNVFRIFLGGVGIVETQIAQAAEFARHAEVQGRCRP